MKRMVSMNDQLINKTARLLPVQSSEGIYTMIIMDFFSIDGLFIA